VKVGVVGPLDPDSFADNILNSLTAMGVEPVALGPVRPSLGHRRVDAVGDLVMRASPRLEVRSQSTLVRRVQEEACDLVVSVSSALMPATVEAMRAGGRPVVLWFPDAVANLDRQLMLVAGYDRLFFKDRVLVERLSALTDLPVAYLPEACNPRWHRPGLDAGRVPEIVVAGNMYPSRVRLLDRLHADGIPLRLYGNGFAKWIPKRPLMARHAGFSITRTHKADVFRSAAGVLNNLHPSEISGVNCRLFEAAGCGAATLCEDRAAVHENFAAGTEVLVFSSYQELRSQCELLLSNPDEGRAIGDAAHRRAHRDHTYEQRLAAILNSVATHA
jgi:spore maturation protein CgeB